MPIKLIILGVFVVGVTIGSVVASQSGGGAGGCDVLGSVAGTQSDSAADATQDSGGEATGSSSGSDGSGTDAGDDGKTDGGDDGSAGDGSGAGGGSSDDGGGADAPDDSGDDQGTDDGGGTDDGAGDADGNDNDNGNDDDDDNDNGNGGTGAALSGDFAGTLTVVTRESLGDDGSGPARTTSLQETITFNATGRPEEITIFGYAGTPNQRTTARQIGEEQTITDSTSSNGTVTEITLVVRVTEALYNSTSFRIRYSLQFNSQGGSLRRSGTGSQLVVGSIDASGKLSYSVDTDYSVRLTAGSIVFNTTNDIEADGLLSRLAAAEQ